MEERERSFTDIKALKGFREKECGLAITVLYDYQKQKIHNFKISTET